MRIENNVIYADKGKKIGRLNAKYREDYYSACSVLPDETIEYFVELEESELPPERPEEGESYEDRVAKRVREEYTIDEEFAIQRQRDSDPQSFKEYFDRVEQIKAEEKAR